MSEENHKPIETLLQENNKHLASIRSMLTFFTLVMVLAIIFQVLNFLLG